MPACAARSPPRSQLPQRALRSAPQELYHSFVDLGLDLLSAVSVWASVLITLETCLVAAISALSVCFYTKWYEFRGAPLSVNLNWTFLSFALVFPLTFSLNEAFRRRELALQTLAIMKANSLAIYAAHRDWDWPARVAGSTCGGRSQLPAGHVDEVRDLLLALNEAQAELLLTPNVGRSRHFYTPGGRRKRAAVHQTRAVMLQRIAAVFCRLSVAVEEMKASGLPGNEAARIRQYSNIAMTAWETLRNIKRYRTPVTTRVFARLCILVQPCLMGPYWAYVAGAGAPEGAQHANFAFAVCFSVFVGVCLSALFNIRFYLEDPFVSEGPDSLDVRRDMGEVALLLGQTLKAAPREAHDPSALTRILVE